ncbi:7TM diverse intracellular signaling domain-containing protein [Leptospira kemamanensis]|uniref:7TM diverse intracellular signaling domain-containing protein n=1 Tax=Leptospira kemamanensis TaxID=2484942 RepID=UPI001FCA21DB|nr:7TM diverse intracellular signaling domain-containing protein [Leptospira kemamanensis]
MFSHRLKFSVTLITPLFFFLLFFTLNCKGQTNESTSGSYQVYYTTEVVAEEKTESSLRSLDWIPLHAPLQLGFYTKPVWIRLEWKGNDFPETLFLENQVAYFDSLRFLQWTSGGLQIQEDGDLVPKRKTLYSEHPFSLFQIDTKALKSHPDVFLEIQTISNFLFAPKIWTSEEMMQSVFQTRDYFLIFFSVLLFVLILNLSVYVNTRNTSFLYYCFYILCSGFYQISYTGYGKIYFWPNDTNWNDRSLVFFGSIALWSVILFSNRFLLLSKRLPKLKLPLLVFSILILTNAFTSLFVKHIICDQIIHFIAIIVSFTLMGAGILVFRQKYKMAIYYIIAWFCLLVAIVSFNLYAFNVLPDHFLLRNAIQYGNFFEIILFQFALLARIGETKETSVLFPKPELKLNVSEQRIANLNPELVIQNIDSSLVKEKLYLDEDLNLQNVASKFQLRPDQLSAIINVKQGMNFNQWINGYRIREACELMKTSPDKNILNIAFSVGFNSKSAFNEAFKRVMGETPTEYRKRMKVGS